MKNYQFINPYIELITFRSFDILKEIFSGLSENTEFVEKTFETFDNARDKLAIYDQTIYLESLLIRQDKISYGSWFRVKSSICQCTINRICKFSFNKTKI